MSSRQSKTRSRSAGRARGGRGGNPNTRAGQSAQGGRSRSPSVARRAASNTRGTSTPRGSHPSRARSARAKRGRRSASSAPYAVKLLRQDHRAVARALEEFESAGRDEKQAIARRIGRMLTVHSQIEEELLYPAARDALSSEDAHLVAEARVEHASLKDLIGQIEDREQLDEQYEAKVCVLGEYVEHHVSEEENELFPRLERTALDLQALGERLEERKRELMGEGALSGAQAGRDGGSQSPYSREDSEEGALEPVVPRSRGGRGHRPAGLHARRR